MTRIPSTTGNPSSSQSSVPRSINDLDLSTFLNLMIAELQNQDPLNPLDNKDMLAQISQLREVGATDRLTETLDSVLLGQNIASATNLIGNDVTAISDDGENVEGIVTRVAIADGEPKVHFDKEVAGTPRSGEGSIEKGTYRYRVVWEAENGGLQGLELGGANGIVATADQQAIEINHLPVSAGPKQVYRTDATGQGPYRLVDTVVSGSQGTFVDRVKNDDRSHTEFADARWNEEVARWRVPRSYVASLRNVSAIRPPSLTSGN